MRLLACLAGWALLASAAPPGVDDALIAGDTLPAKLSDFRFFVGDRPNARVTPGALEGSNVQVAEEMVDMIAAQRTYEMNTKVLSAADNMLQNLAQVAR